MDPLKERRGAQTSKYGMQFNEICSLPQGININMRKVDLQAFTYVLVLSETHQ